MSDPFDFSKLGSMDPNDPTTRQILSEMAREAYEETVDDYLPMFLHLMLAQAGSRGPESTAHGINAAFVTVTQALATLLVISVPRQHVDETFEKMIAGLRYQVDVSLNVGPDLGRFVAEASQVGHLKLSHKINADLSEAVRRLALAVSGRPS